MQSSHHLAELTENPYSFWGIKISDSQQDIIHVVIVGKDTIALVTNWWW